VHLPPYVGFGGTLEYSPPITADRVRMYAFLLPASRTHLDRMLHARFTEPSQGAVLAVSAVPFVLFYVSVIPAIRLREDVGWYRERESGVMVFGFDQASERLFTTLDYLFVDSGQAMANGREIFGFPKQIGSFQPDDPWLDCPDVPLPVESPAGFRLDTLGVERFGPDAWAANHELWRLERVGEGGAPTSVVDPRGMMKLLADALGAFGSRHVVGDLLHPFADVEPDRSAAVSVPYRAPLGRGGVVTLDTHPYHTPDPLGQNRMAMPVQRAATASFNLIEELAQNRLSTLLLKQVRSATREGAASFQAVIQLRAERTMRSMGVLAGQYQLRVKPLDSAPMASTFGWTPSGAVPSVLSVFTEYDFVYSHGQTLWSALPSVDG
jgi:hypothetical protein